MRMRDFERGTDVVAQCDRLVKCAVPAYSCTDILIFLALDFANPTVNKVMAPLLRLSQSAEAGAGHVLLHYY